MLPSRSRSALNQDHDQPWPPPTLSASQSEQGQVQPWASDSGSAQQVPLPRSVSDSSAISSHPCLPPLLPARPELQLSLGEGGSPRPPVNQEPLSEPQCGRGVQASDPQDPGWGGLSPAGPPPATERPPRRAPCREGFASEQHLLPFFFCNVQAVKKACLPSCAVCFGLLLSGTRGRGGNTCFVQPG